MGKNLKLLSYYEIKPDCKESKELLNLSEHNKEKVTSSVNLVERSLLIGLKSGDRSAFSTIFLAYYKDLVMFAYRWTRNADDAEEIVQDVFVKLWEDHETINITVSLKSYLLKTILNRCINLHKHNKVRDLHHSYVLSLQDNFDLDTENYITYSELREKLQKALEVLPEEISMVFIMNRFKGLKYHEIARILGVSVRTIEVRMGKALHLLRNYFKEFLIFISFIIKIL